MTKLRLSWDEVPKIRELMRSRSGRDVKSWAPSPAWLLSVDSIKSSALTYHAMHSEMLWESFSRFLKVIFEILWAADDLPPSGKVGKPPPFGFSALLNMLNVWDFNQRSWHSAQPSPRALHALPSPLLIVSIDLHETGAKSQVESQDWTSLDQRMSMMMDLLAYEVPDISFWDNVPWSVDTPAELRIYEDRFMDSATVH